MAIVISRSSFMDDLAWVEVHFDNVALEVVSVVYENLADKTAVANISQPPNRNDTFTVPPGTAVTTQAIPHNRYTYHTTPKGVAPDFTYVVSFA